MHLLGLDVGTTGCKAVVFDTEGNQLGSGFREYQIDSDASGKAEQDAERVWALSQEVIREAIARSVGASGSDKRSAGEVAALGISVQGDAIIPVDEKARALSPAILGMDYRPAREAELIADRFGAKELFERTGMRPHPVNSLIKLLWLRENHPETYRRAHRIVTYADFILAKLTGRFVIDNSMASRTMAFNLRDRCWDRGLLGELDVSPELFSEVVPSASAVGTILPAVADTIGLSDRVLVVAGAHDQPAAAVGSGVIDGGQAGVNTGTAEVLSAVSNTPLLGPDVFASYYPCYLHAVPERYFTFALNHVGGLLLRWYRDNFATAEVEQAKREQKDVYETIISKMPAKPTPVLVLPHFNGSGTPWCDMESKGAIVGLSIATTRHDIARSILESQSYELKINLEKLRGVGLPLSSVSAIGGGARSKDWLAIKASILDMPLKTLRCKESGCLGAAILAGAGAGIYSTVADGVKRAVQYESVVEPDRSLVGYYHDRFAVYRELYPTLLPLNRLL